MITLLLVAESPTVSSIVIVIVSPAIPSKGGVLCGGLENSFRGAVGNLGQKRAQMQSSYGAQHESSYLVAGGLLHLRAQLRHIEGAVVAMPHTGWCTGSTAACRLLRGVHPVARVRSRCRGVRRANVIDGGVAELLQRVARRLAHRRWERRERGSGLWPGDVAAEPGGQDERPATAVVDHVAVHEQWARLTAWVDPVAAARALASLVQSRARCGDCSLSA